MGVQCNFESNQVARLALTDLLAAEEAIHDKSVYFQTFFFYILLFLYIPLQLGEMSRRKIDNREGEMTNNHWSNTHQIQIYFL